MIKQLLTIAVAMALVSAAHGQTFQKLLSDQKCDKCFGYLIPGKHLPSPHTVYRIDSDLPEIFTSTGVLYSTEKVLPPFLTNEGVPVSEEMRTQVAKDFTTIDDSFEVFLYHISLNHKDGETRRIVVFVENRGQNSVTIQPRQSVHHGPIAGQPTSVESKLGRDVLTENWEVVFPSVTIPPGAGNIVGYTRQIGTAQDGPDAAKSEALTGILRADVAAESGKPNLVVSVVAVPGSIPVGDLPDQTPFFMEKGADSGETYMDLNITPPECHVRRVVGTAKNVLWRNDPVTIDVAKMPEDDLFFQFAKFAVQSQGCMDARQSIDLLLSPKYVHPESIGNYMMEYHVTLKLTNSGEAPRKVDFQYGKTDAPIGLAWQMIVAPEEKDLATLAQEPVTIGWAGMKRTEGEPYYKKTMLEEGPLTIEPGETEWVSTRLMVLGTSSLPWQLHVVPVE